MSIRTSPMRGGFLSALFASRTPLVTDAEVLEEILHRYTAIERIDAIRPAFDLLLAIVEDVFPVESTDVERARDLVLNRPGLSARDAVHLAIMQRKAVKQIMSFDSGFDSVSGVNTYI